MNSDFKDLLRAFSDGDVRYLIVGGYAYAEYVEPRYTKDLDIWVEASPDNADRVLAALRDFGAPITDLTREDLSQRGTVYQLGIAPNRIDLITAADGVEFGDCWARKKIVELDGIRLNYISASDLATNKESTGRLQDQADAEYIRRSIQMSEEKQ